MTPSIESNHLTENFPPEAQRCESVTATFHDQNNSALRAPDPRSGQTGGEVCSGADIREELNTQNSKLKTESESSWLTARDIARALGIGWHRKKVHRLAERQNWPARQHQNRLEYQPPPHIAGIVLSSPTLSRPDAQHAPTVRFRDLVSGDAQRETVLFRQQACELLKINLRLGKEVAMSLIVRQMKQQHPAFNISERSLRRWADQYQHWGLDGLVEQKRGIVGRKAYVRDLEPEHLLQAAAGAIEHGIKGRLNVARSYRENLVANPTLNGAARVWCHGDNQSKGHVPKSVRDAIKHLAPPLTTKLIQIGPRAAKLDGPYTECSYAELKPGQAFTADDMTANVYVWVEWPNEQGFLLIRPQILAAMDVASMAWLELRVIIRPKGQYNKDDVWGLIGQLLDHYGKFDTAILEGGIWQSNVVIGQKTYLSDKDRFGGLESLGVNIIHTRTPHGKIIETAFNQLQHQSDACLGFCGRMEMKDCPEAVKQHLAQVRSGKAHPRQYFLHLNEYTAHMLAAMKSLNHERGDGKILRGQSPWEKWLSAGQRPVTNMVGTLSTASPSLSSSDAPRSDAHRSVGASPSSQMEDCGPLLPQIPDSAKWMYRSAFNVSKVSRNGIRIDQGSGRNKVWYTYSNPVALEPWRGQRVITFWNDYDPDTDAVVYTIRDGRPHQFLCVAERVPDLPRLGAGEEATAAEATRKKLSHQLARTQSESLAPFLKRTVRTLEITSRSIGTASPSLPSSDGYDIKARLDAARAEAAKRRDQKEQAAKLISRAIAQAEDLTALAAPERSAGGLAAPERSDSASLSELNELFSPQAETDPF